MLNFKDVFSKHENGYGRCGIIQHRIEILEEKPKRCGVRPMNPAMQQILKDAIDDLQKNDFTTKYK